MRAHLALYQSVVLAESALSRAWRERIAVLVSAANRCDYCVAHHTEALRMLGEREDVIAAVQAQRPWPDASEADAELLDWARIIAERPHVCTGDAPHRLRRLGWSDEALLDAALTAAYFSFVNRLVLSLGAEVEDDVASTCGPA